MGLPYCLLLFFIQEIASSAQLYYLINRQERIIEFDLRMVEKFRINPLPLTTLDSFMWTSGFVSGFNSVSYVKLCILFHGSGFLQEWESAVQHTWRLDENFKRS